MEKKNQAERKIEHSYSHIFIKIWKIVGAHKYLFCLNVLKGNALLLVKIKSSFAILR